MPRAEVLDIHDWQPLSINEVAAVMRSAPAQWWIAGGWAIDLFLGRQTRQHADTDVLILTSDQLAVQRHLADWRLYKTKQPTPSQLGPWRDGEFLSPDSDIHDVWIKRQVGGPWRFQIMLMEDCHSRWVYRRDRRISGEINALGWRTDAGLPVIRAEIQLLYKSRPAGHRPKDDADFAAAVDHLDPSGRRWLADAMRLSGGEDHPWLRRLL